MRTVSCKKPNNATNSAKIFSLIVAGAMLLVSSAFQVFAQMPAFPGYESDYVKNTIDPFHIIDNVYFVGTTAHSPAYLFTTADGHILIDSTDETKVPGIVENIKALGFSVSDIKLLLSTHAHSDHVGGHAMMKELTGATMLATEADAEVIESGGAADYRPGKWQPAVVDRIVQDGESIRLGGMTLTAHLTPGHTKGCTTWTTVVEENGNKYNLVLLGGLRMNPGEPLVGHPKYPNMPEDFAYSFAVVKTLPADVFLGAHGYWYNVEEKIKRLQQGASVNPFIDPEGYRNAIEGWEKTFLDQLKTERQHSMDTRL